MRSVRPGQRIRLQGKATGPDGDELTIGWWQYSAAGTYGDRETADIALGNGEYFVPLDIKPGETIHLILDAADNGSPSLHRYQRLVLVGQ